MRMRGKERGSPLKQPDAAGVWEPRASSAYPLPKGSVKRNSDLVKVPPVRRALGVVT